MITQAVIPLSILTAVPPAGCSSGTVAEAKCYCILYIREFFVIYINYLADKYSYLIGYFLVKLPI